MLWATIHKYRYRFENMLVAYQKNVSVEVPETMDITFCRAEAGLRRRYSSAISSYHTAKELNPKVQDKALF